MSRDGSLSLFYLVLKFDIESELVFVGFPLEFMQFVILHSLYFMEVTVGRPRMCSFDFIQGILQDGCHGGHQVIVVSQYGVYDDPCYILFGCRVGHL